MVTVKMKHTTFFEDVHYVKDQEYEMEEEQAKALGSFVVVVKEETKEKVEKAPKNKMMTSEDKQVKKK